MPRWVCEKCHSVMQVNPELLGEWRACRKCSHVGLVTDVAPQPTEAEPAPTDVYDAIPVTLYRLVLIIAGLVCLVMTGDPASRVPGVIGFATVVLSWSLAGIKYELECCRRVLDAIRKSSRP